MVFISYCQIDKQMCDEFVVMMAPLKRYGSIEIWSDVNIKPGTNWKSEINRALDKASVAVLMVSKAFLASPFIQEVELPYFLEATQKRGVKFMWVLVSDCLWSKTPLNPIQAAYPIKKPIAQLSVARQQTALRIIAERIDEAWKEFECPLINGHLNGHAVYREEPNLHVLAEPARRKTEVFVYSEGAKQWWHTGTITPGKKHCRCYFGDEKTENGQKFRLLAITTDETVGGMMLPPQDRTRSLEVTVTRKSGSHVK